MLNNLRQVRKLALSKEKSVYALVQNSNISSSLSNNEQIGDDQAELTSIIQEYKTKIPLFKIEQAYQNSIKLAANRKKLLQQRQAIFTKIINLIKEGEIDRHNFAVYLKGLLADKNFLFPNPTLDIASLDNFEFLKFASRINSNAKLNKLCWAIFSQD